MSWAKRFLKNNPKVSAMLGAAAVAAASAYAPGSGPIVRSVLANLLGL